MRSLVVKHQTLVKQIFAFGCVGVVATLTHYFIALLAIEIIGVSSYLGNFFGYCSAVCVSLFGHSIFTFKKKVDLSVTKRFIVVSLSTLLASEVILYVMQRYFHLDHRAALLVVVMSIPVVTFFLTKFWVYSHPKTRPE